jgi:hypothetical protein
MCRPKAYGDDKLQVCLLYYRTKRICPLPSSTATPVENNQNFDSLPRINLVSSSRLQQYLVFRRWSQIALSIERRVSKCLEISSLMTREDGESPHRLLLLISSLRDRFPKSVLRIPCWGLIHSRLTRASESLDPRKRVSFERTRPRSSIVLPCKSTFVKTDRP